MTELRLHCQDDEIKIKIERKKEREITSILYWLWAMGSKGSQTQTTVGLDCLARHTTMVDLLFIVYAYNIMCTMYVQDMYVCLS